MNKKEFYEECSKIIGVEIEYKEKLKPATRINRKTGQTYTPMTLATRWGGREPGNGRVPGFGLIRVFNQSYIQINIKNPYLNNIYDNYENALTALKTIFITKSEI